MRNLIAEKLDISIHALREESGPCYAVACNRSIKFQSTLSVRRAAPTTASASPPARFQSTLSVRRAASTRSGACGRARDFNPRSP